ncbi:MAG TPA: hypothetical protein VEK10_11240 [Steroidobacteraceae bacterium]|nr:hypothetical protein [Steroidobacteraceae bacterium]
MRELVIVIPDLYLKPQGSGAAPALASGRFAGLEHAGRFGVRAALGEGWRAWLAQQLARADLAQVAPARIAAAVLAEPQAQSAQAATYWIATPLHLTAGLARVHLDHRGVLALSAAERATLATAFAGTFGSSGFSLTPLPSGDFLLKTPGVGALRTVEPARCIGSDLAEALPQGAAAAALRRLVAEIEMWLHAHPLNEARQQRRELPVTTLWLWGAEGQALARTAGAARPPLPLAYGRDAWLEGLWRLEGDTWRTLPAHLEDVLAESQAERGLIVAQVAAALQGSPQSSAADALARLDERFIAPALAALPRGRLARAVLVVNDVRVALGRTSRFKLWRRPRAGLARFA